MRYLVSLYSWENPRLYSSNSELEKGDMVVVEGEFGNDLGTIQASIEKTEETPAKSILRKAIKRDIETFKKNEEKKKEVLDISRLEAKKLKLEMKIIDACITLDGSNIVVIFTADGRIDFRELVKILSKKFYRSIRMQQIGSRDEARKLGDCGICGRELCCVKFPGSLPSISTEMARIQQIAHRGSERISGLCGRLMCCLSYEAEQYKKLMNGMPEIYSSVKLKEGKGTVIEINPIKQEIKVKMEDDQIIIAKKEDLK